jgi:hypothetical protein
MELNTKIMIMSIWILQGGVMESDGQLKKEPRPPVDNLFKTFKKISWIV